MATIPSPVSIKELVNFEAPATNSLGIVESIKDLIITVIQNSIVSVATVMIIVGAYFWMFAMGSADKIKTGQKLIGSALFGLFFVTIIDKIPGFIDEKAEDVSAIIKSSDISQLIQSIIIYVQTTISVLAVAAIIYAGFMYLTSGEDDAKASNAVGGIISAAVGMFFVGASDLFVRKVFHATGRVVKVSSDSAKTVETLLSGIINIALEISVFIAVALLIYAGFELMTSGGAKGKQTIVNVIIGLFLILVSYGFVQLVYQMIS